MADRAGRRGAGGQRAGEIDRYGFHGPPIVIAAAAGATSVVRALLDAGATAGRAAAQAAAQHRRAGALLEFLDARPELADDALVEIAIVHSFDDKPPRARVDRAAQLAIVRGIVARGQQPEPADSPGPGRLRWSLLRAVRNAQPDLLVALLDAGADPGAPADARARRRGGRSAPPRRQRAPRGRGRRLRAGAARAVKVDAPTLTW